MCAPWTSNPQGLPRSDTQYTLLRTCSAVSIVQGHPFVGRGGTLLVSEAVSP